MKFANKKSFLTLLFAIFLTMSLSTAAFADGSTNMIFPNGTHASPNYINGAPSYFNWTQSSQDNYFVISVSADPSSGVSFGYTTDGHFSAGSATHTFYLDQALKDSLPRNTELVVGVTTFYTNQFGGLEISGTTNGRFIITN